MGKKAKLSLSLFLVVVFLLGFYIGAQGKRAVTSTNDKEIYEYLKTFSDVIDLVKKNYVEETKDKDLIYSAIKGILESLDPHSSFLPPDMYKDMQSETKGEFGGIGIEITIKDGFPTVITPIEDTPAYKAGLKSGDHIIRIDGKPTKNMSLMDVVKMIRGAKGKSVSLTIVREGTPGVKEYNIVRDIIVVKSVKFRMLEDNYGYVRIVQFQERTSRDLNNALKELEKANKEKPLKGLILDLRNDPGGLLEQAVEVSDKFLTDDVIVSIEGRQKEENKVKFYAKSRKDDYLGPLVVLVNEGSASASEIVAGALQDYKRAIVVGTKTFGKGSVQTIFPLGDGSAVRLTTAKYFTPKGRSIQAEGITPDIVVDNNMVKTKDKIVPLKEKDLEKRNDTDKDIKKLEDINTKTLEEEDFQLHMGLQILKSWEALRGKSS
ncbi:MAG: Carboxy-terminal processing protease CtpB precursor [Syntrophorhabdus sp. PtaU1.Bin058]|nr:MAG: Carboxy-terminal processing protease CtpB precursor [Syntrophorhabdus sp. PtaU1.Bin058]